MKRRFIPLVLTLTALVGMALGCNENKAPTAAETAVTDQKRIEDIKNDPNLPAAAKENIIRNMQQQQADSTAKGIASGKAQAEAAKQRESGGASK